MRKVITVSNADLNRPIYEGWTAQDFIDSLQGEADLIMSGRHIHQPFRNKKELGKWCKENQPYYKKSVPVVVDYFAARYCL